MSALVGLAAPATARSLKPEPALPIANVPASTDDRISASRSRRGAASSAAAMACAWRSISASRPSSASCSANAWFRSRSAAAAATRAASLDMFPALGSRSGGQGKAADFRAAASDSAIAQAVPAGYRWRGRRPINTGSSPETRLRCAFPPQPPSGSARPDLGRARCRRARGVRSRHRDDAAGERGNREVPGRVVEPRHRTVTVYQPNAVPELFNCKQELNGGSSLPGFQVQVGELFSR